MLQAAQRDAFVVEPDAVGELGPRERVDFVDVVQELDELIDSRTDLLHLIGLFDRVEIVAHMVDAASLWRHDVIETREVAHKQGFCGCAIGVEAVIGHRLPAAGLVARVYDFMAEALQ